MCLTKVFQIDGFWLCLTNITLNNECSQDCSPTLQSLGEHEEPHKGLEALFELLGVLPLGWERDKQTPLPFV